MATERNAEQTRTRILEAAHDEIYLNGYKGMRIEAILQKTNLAKGALYHHFPNKLALGYAVVEEILMSHFQQIWNEFLEQYRDPITAMQKLFDCKSECVQDGNCFNGCAVNNLGQEMSATDDGFRIRLQKVVENVINHIHQALAKGQVDGHVRSDIDPYQTALYLHCCYQGIMGTAKCMQAPHLLPNMFVILNDYLETLRVRH